MKQRIFIKRGLAALALAGAAGASEAFRAFMPDRFLRGTAVRQAQAAGFGFRESLPIPLLLENMSASNWVAPKFGRSATVRA
jgi:hypothetical protein